jgi:2'-5' RNA ligase
MLQENLFGSGDQKPVEVHRLFFALMPDEATRDRLHHAAMQLKKASPLGGRWINPRRYHLTLQFLGDFDGLPQALATQACAAAAKVKVAPFPLELDRAGGFRNRSIPWWLGPAAEVPGLATLWHGLGLELARAGVRVPGGQGFRPHVTVLRDARHALPDTPIAPVIWHVDSFSLVHSVLGAQNAYTSLGTWPLAG